MKSTEVKNARKSSHIANPHLSRCYRGPFFSLSKKSNQPFFGPDTIQPKLKIGQPNDKYEQEADRVADAVMKMPDLKVQRQSAEEEEELQMQSLEEEEELQMQPLEEEEELQMKCQECEYDEHLQTMPALQMEKARSNYTSPEIIGEINASIGSGYQLPAEVNGEMSTKIGADFSDVSVHTDSTAEQLNQTLGARAFTVGNDIFFNRNEFSPQSSKGKHLLAHELTHVIQQTRTGNYIQRQSDPGLWCDALVELVNYEDQHGRLNTLVEYNSFDNEDLIPLNHNIPSIYGEVDVDWMLRLAVIQYPFIIGSIITPSMSEGFGSIASRLGYLALKSFWIAIDPRTENWNWDSLTEEGNWNSSTVVTNWIHGTETLSQIFAPALALCTNTNGSSDVREPTY